MAAQLPPLPNMLNPITWAEVLTDIGMSQAMAGFTVSPSGGGVTCPETCALLNDNYSKGKDLTALLANPPKEERTLEDPAEGQPPVYYVQRGWRLSPIVKQRVENLVVTCSFYIAVGWTNEHITKGMLSKEVCALTRTQCDGLYNTFSSGQKAVFGQVKKTEEPRDYIERFQAKADTVPGAAWCNVLGMYMREEKNPVRSPVLPGKSWSDGSESVVDELIRFGKLDNPHSQEDLKSLFQHLSGSLSSVPSLHSDIKTFQKKNDFEGALKKIEKMHMTEDDFRTAFDKAEKVYLKGVWDSNVEIKNFSKSFNDAVTEMKTCAEKLPDKHAPNDVAVRRQFLDSVAKTASDKLMVSSLANYRTTNTAADLNAIQDTLADLDPNKKKKAATNFSASIATAKGVRFEQDAKPKAAPKFSEYPTQEVWQEG